MSKIKQNLTYYFTVEGETELFYLERLQILFNSHANAKYNLVIKNAKKRPGSYVKGANIIYKTQITHLFDYESSSEYHQSVFKGTLKEMKESMKVKKEVVYRNGYSNYTFEIWLLWHKIDLFRHFDDRSQYLYYINTSFSEDFHDMDEFKREANIKRVLSKISVDDVKRAVVRAKYIEQKYKNDGIVKSSYMSFQYFDKNPSTCVHEVIEEIITKMGI